MTVRCLHAEVARWGLRLSVPQPLGWDSMCPFCNGRWCSDRSRCRRRRAVMPSWSSALGEQGIEEVTSYGFEVVEEIPVDGLAENYVLRLRKQP